MTIRFHRATPILRVRSLTTSIQHYVQVLGFTLDFEDKGVFASVSRDACTIFLCENDQGHAGGWAWVGVANAEALHEELCAKGATIRHPPTNYPWAYEMQVQDPDGNVLRFGSDPKRDQPAGEWLDMYGKRWGPAT